MRQFFSPVWASAIAAATGAATWWYVSAVTRHREAWDSNLYFTLAFPLIGALAVVLALLEPRKPWRWAMIPFGAQALVAIVKNPTANLMPLGLITFGVLGGVCAIPAALAAWLRQRLFPV